VRLELELDRECVTPGEQLTGRVVVLEGGPSRSLSLTVRFCERSPQLESTAFSTNAVLHQGDLTTGQTLEFGCELPKDALPSVKGKVGELFWELEASSDEPGVDTQIRRRFEVAAVEPR
jgi:hypothetical protein